jgi:hypothetical protein
MIESYFATKAQRPEGTKANTISSMEYKVQGEQVSYLRSFVF